MSEFILSMIGFIVLCVLNLWFTAVLVSMFVFGGIGGLVPLLTSKASWRLKVLCLSLAVFALLFWWGLIKIAPFTVMVKI